MCALRGCAWVLVGEHAAALSDLAVVCARRWCDREKVACIDRNGVIVHAWHGQVGRWPGWGMVGAARAVGRDGAVRGVCMCARERERGAVTGRLAR